MPVNLIENVLRTGSSEWPVSLDVGTGELTLNLRSQTYRLKALTWGAKRLLARLAPLGEEVIRRYICLACATPGVWPEDEAEAEALLEAALSITDPGGDGLPFSAATLLRVTHDVASGLGAAAGELDTQAAADVEALWRTLSLERPRARDDRGMARPGEPAAKAEAWPPPPAGKGPSTREDWPELDPGWSRIVVLPDEQEAAAVIADKAVPGEKVGCDDVPGAPSTADPVRHGKATAAAAGTAKKAPAREPVLASVVETASPGREQLNRFRFRFDSEIASPLRAPAVAMDSPPAPPEERTRTEMPARPRLDVARATDEREVRMPHRPRAAEPEVLLDAFAEQLERAAAAAGIDVEI